jgi:hypothetical protein
MKTILIPAPPEPDLKKLVLKIEALEKKIAQAKAVADSASSRKQAILQKYL